MNPYISFPGTARQALEFYKGVFGGTLTVSTFGEFGSQHSGYADKIMHGMLETDHGYTLMAADTPPGMEHPRQQHRREPEWRRAARLLGQAVERRHRVGSPGEADVGR
jgi:uncharacterized glyoxalase superfamily protein PhnB